MHGLKTLARTLCGLRMLEMTLHGLRMLEMTLCGSMLLQCCARACNRLCRDALEITCNAQQPSSTEEACLRSELEAQALVLA